MKKILKFHGVFLNQNNPQEVEIISDSGSLIIKTPMYETQIVYLPAGSMDTILTWGRIANEKFSSLDLDNPETQIKATFQLSLEDLAKLKQSLRGKQVFLKSPDYVVQSQIALGIQLVLKENRTFIEKIAEFPKSMSDCAAIGRLSQLKQETDMLVFLKDHPNGNLIEMEEIITDCQSVSLILEYCNGGDLLKLLNSKTIKLNIPLMLENLLQGLRHLHSLNIVHRDIKLQNILFLDSNNPSTLKIADFGLSCFKQQIQYYNPRCGTPGYTAPEVFAQNSNYDEKVDIYSAGIVFYNMLTLKNPFGNSKNVQDILKRNIRGLYDETNLVLVKQNFPQAYDLLTQMLDIDPKKRPSAEQCLLHEYFQECETRELDTKEFVSATVHQSKKPQLMLNKRVKI